MYSVFCLTSDILSRAPLKQVSWRLHVRRPSYPLFSLINSTWTDTCTIVLYRRMSKRKLWISNFQRYAFFFVQLLFTSLSRYTLRNAQVGYFSWIIQLSWHVWLYITQHWTQAHKGCDTTITNPVGLITYAISHTEPRRIVLDEGDEWGSRCSKADKPCSRGDFSFTRVSRFCKNRR